MDDMMTREEIRAYCQMVLLLETGILMDEHNIPVSRWEGICGNIYQRISKPVFYDLDAWERFLIGHYSHFNGHRDA